MEKRGLRWVVVLVIVMAFVAGFLIRGIRPPARPAIERILDEKQQAAALFELLAQNKVVNVPRGFSFWTDETRIRCQDAKQKSGAWLRLVHVSYPLLYQGNRGCSFVFDDTGYCLFWSPDQAGHIRTWNRGLSNLTGSDNLEKVVWFGGRDLRYRAGDLMGWPPENMPWVQDDSGNVSCDFDVLRVFRIRPGPVRKLLEVRYNIGRSQRSGDTPWYDPELLPPATAGKPWLIVLSKMRKPEEDVKFIWSADQQSYIAEGPESDEWELAFGD